MSLLDSVRRAVAVLAAEGRVGVLVGGLGVSARAEPRFTRDADLVVAVDTDAQAESVVHAFIVEGYRVQALLEQSGVDRLSGARLIDPDGIEIDLLTASSGIEPEIVVDAEEVEIVPGLRVHVAATGHLIALKLLSVAPGRETDAADLRALGSGPLGVSAAVVARLEPLWRQSATSAARRRHKGGTWPVAGLVGRRAFARWVAPGATRCANIWPGGTGVGGCQSGLAPG